MIGFVMNPFATTLLVDDLRRRLNEAMIVTKYHRQPKFMTIDELIISDEEFLQGSNDMLISSDGEVKFALVDMEEYHELMCEIPLKLSNMQNELIKVSSTFRDDMLKLRKALAEGGTDWNVPFNPLRQAMFSSLINEYFAYYSDVNYSTIECNEKLGACWKEFRREE
jgi:hypothetical protein